MEQKVQVVGEICNFMCQSPWHLESTHIGYRVRGAPQRTGRCQLRYQCYIGKRVIDWMSILYITGYLLPT